MLHEIIKEFDTEKEKYSKMYADKLEAILEHIGMKDVDVIRKKDGMRGRLKVYPECGIRSEIRFAVYKKDGTFSMNTKPIYIFNHEEYPRELRNNFEVVG